MAIYNFTITGATPLIMHANDIEARDVLMADRKSTKGGTKGDDRSPPQTWKSYLYRGDEGNVTVPVENLMAMLLAGGMKCKLQGKETLKVHTQRIEFDALDYDLQINGGPISLAKIDAIKGEFGEHAIAARAMGFRLFTKPVTVGTSSHVRVRPMFTGWSISGKVTVSDEDTELLTLSVLRDLFNTCGRVIGLGDWRPGPTRGRVPGRYGRFTAEVTR